MDKRFTTPPARVEQPVELLVRQRIEESIEAKQRLLDGSLTDDAIRLAAVASSSLRTGGKLLIFGNGGSAADATHMAAEFVGRFGYDRGPLAAMSLTENAAAITAIGNDYTYDEIFARQIRAFGQAGDVAIAISTSGASRNVVSALKVAGEMGIHTAAFTGNRGGPISGVAEMCLEMPSGSTARVQECYLLVAHIVCELVERALFPLHTR
jgi:D-sedoheptulose 7-phosphate isomerase